MAADSRSLGNGINYGEQAFSGNTQKEHLTAVIPHLSEALMRRLSLLLALLVAVPAVAQNTDIESLSGLQFNFGNPGARALGMGGAFLGLADDASAVEANPAGLTILRKPEIALEARNYQGSQILSTSGTFPDVERTAFSNYSNRIQIAFASAVYPVKNFTFGAYFHEPLRNKGSGFVVPQDDPFTLRTKGTPRFFRPPGGNPVSEEECDRLISEQGPFACSRGDIKPFVTAVDIQQKTWGAAGGWQLARNFSIGAAVRYQTFRENALTVRFDEFVSRVEQVSVQATGKLGSDGDIKISEESDVSFTGGVKWTVNEKFSVGAVYKQGPSFVAPIFIANVNTDNELLEVAEATFHAPDIYGVGISYRPLPALTLNADGVRVKYSNLVDDFISIVKDVQDFEGTVYEANDVTEIRLGAEYFLPTKIPFAVRAGVWRDPAHSVVYTGPLNVDDGVGAALLYPKGNPEDHYAIGAGLAWPRFQIDVAYDNSDTFKVLSLSLVLRR